MAYIYDIADTWSGGGAFTGIKLNVTDSGSTAGSLLMDLQVGGVSQLTVGKSGNLQIPNGAFIRTAGVQPNSGIRIGGNGFNDPALAVQWVNGAATALSTGRYNSGSSWLGLNSSSIFGWGSITDLGLAAAVLDTILLRDAANTLAQRNGVNAQAFNLYNTYTDASNYERGFMRFVSNVLEIGSEALGTGTVRNLIFKVGTTTSLTLNTGGAVSPSFQVGAGGVAAAGYSVNGNAATGLSWPASGRAILFSNINAGEGTVTLNAFNSGFALNEAGNILSARYSSSLNDIALGITTQLSWVDAANSRTGAPDTGLKRNSAGVVKVTNGSTGTGQLIFIVPTTNPGITGALWNNAGTLAIS